MAGRRAMVEKRYGDLQSVCNILVVDDEEDVRDVLRIFLSDHGHEVHEVSNGEEALAWLARHEHNPPCLAIVDLKMPLLDGWDLLAAMRSHHQWKALPVLVLSATIRADAPPPVLDARRFWSKPINFSELEKVHEHCARHTAMRPALT
jgi:CheY-like chemotaxis protein